MVLPAFPSAPSGVHDPDAATVACAVAGDRQAFAELVRRHQGRVFRFIRRQVPVACDAEDLTQDTFLEAFRKLDSFRGASRFSTWLTGIALNIVRNHRSRAPSMRHPTEGDDVLDGIADRGPDPHDRARSNATVRAVAAALDALPADVREALVMVSLEGLRYEEAADIAGVPVGTMKSRVFRARRLLRESLAAAGTLELLEGEPG